MRHCECILASSQPQGPAAGATAAVDRLRQYAIWRRSSGRSGLGELLTFGFVDTCSDLNVNANNELAISG